MPHAYSNNVLDLFLIRRAVLPEQIIGIRLCRRFWVWVIEKILNPQENLFDSDGGLPVLVLVQDAKANGARRVDVGVEERWHELAYYEILWISGL